MYICVYADTKRVSFIIIRTIVNFNFATESSVYCAPLIINGEFSNGNTGESFSTRINEKEIDKFWRRGIRLNSSGTYYFVSGAGRGEKFQVILTRDVYQSCDISAVLRHWEYCY